MGFRSTMTTEHIYMELPQWFVDKHKDLHIHQPDNGKYTLPLSYKFEHKWHTEFLEDLQKVLKEQEQPERIDDVELILFHECDGITKVKVSKDKISYYEPQEWYEVDNITHNYCYGCSEPTHTKLPQSSKEKK